jgi:aryl-alcohol dehydrogenase-like predicted oxidoreductase
VALKGKWDKVVLATKAFNAMGDGPNDKGARAIT